MLFIKLGYFHKWGNGLKGGKRSSVTNLYDVSALPNFCSEHVIVLIDATSTTSIKEDITD